MSKMLDEKLHAAIDGLNDKQKKAVLGIVTVLAHEKQSVSDHWADESFVAEMDDRYKEYRSGKATLITLEEVESKARKAAQKLKSQKAD